MGIYSKVTRYGLGKGSKRQFAIACMIGRDGTPAFDGPNDEIAKIIDVDMRECMQPCTQIKSPAKTLAGIDHPGYLETGSTSPHQSEDASPSHELRA